MPQIIALVGGLLALAFVANRLSSWTKVPDVVVLLIVGLLFGPFFRLLQPSQFQTVTPILGTLALILILFEGGLELNLRGTLHHFPGSLLLASLAYGMSVLALWLLASRGFHVPSRPALLFGAVLGCTSSTVVLPILQQIAASERVKITLMLEASWGDVLAVLTVGALINIPAGGIVGSLAQKLALQILGSIAMTALIGALWTRLLPHLSEVRYWQVLTFSIVLLLYAATEAFGGNGLIAALAFGLTLSNVRRLSGRLGENLFARTSPGSTTRTDSCFSFRTVLPGAHLLLCADRSSSSAQRIARTGSAHWCNGCRVVPREVGCRAGQPLGMDGFQFARSRADRAPASTRIDNGCACSSGCARARPGILVPDRACLCGHLADQLAGRRRQLPFQTLRTHFGSVGIAALILAEMASQASEPKRD